MARPEKGRLWGALSVLALFSLALFFIWPVFAGPEKLGVSDWDWTLFQTAVPAKTIGEFWQFPLWNPWYCGGSPMLASPQSTFLSPFYIFVLLFGEVNGVRFIIAACTITGVLGMYFLARTIGLSRISSFLPPVVFIFSSWFVLRATEGHLVFLPFAFLPFVAAFYIRSFEKGRALPNIILSALFLVWIFFAGGAYPFPVTIIFLSFYTLFSVISRKSLKPVINLVLIGVFAALLGAVKVLPSYEFFSEAPRKTQDTQYHSVEILKDALFSRTQHVMEQDKIFYQTTDETQAEYLQGFWGGKRPWGWHEYGAFVGVAAFVLYLAAFIYFRRSWIWLTISLIALIMSLGEATALNIWSPLHHLPVFSSLHGPSRVIILFVFAFSMAAGIALSSLEEGRNERGNILRRAVAALAVIVVLVEIATVSRPLLNDVFVDPKPPVVENEYRQIIIGDPVTMTYRHFLQNRGVVNCYETMNPPKKAAPYGDDTGRTNPGYRGEAYLAEGQGSAVIRRFTPNEVTVEVESQGSGVLVLNQNYFKGWMVKKGASREEAANRYGLVSTSVNAGKADVVFYYSPRSYRLGLAISIFSFVVFGFIAVRGLRKRAK